MAHHEGGGGGTAQLKRQAKITGAPIIQMCTNSFDVHALELAYRTGAVTSARLLRAWPPAAHEHNCAFGGGLRAQAPRPCALRQASTSLWFPAGSTQVLALQSGVALRTALHLMRQPLYSSLCAHAPWLVSHIRQYVKHVLPVEVRCPVESHRVCNKTPCSFGQFATLPSMCLSSCTGACRAWLQPQLDALSLATQGTKVSLRS